MRVTVALAIVLLSSPAAFASCSPIRSWDPVGKEVWVTNGGYPVTPRTVSEHRGFDVNEMKQVGPERWDTDYSKSVPLGAHGVVTKVVGHLSPETPYYYEVELDDGTTATMAYQDLAEFDYMTCAPEEVLVERQIPNGLYYPWIEYLPMKLKEGARPVDHLGEWIRDDLLERIAMLDCDKYDKLVLGKTMYIECAPVWRDGQEPSYSTTLDVNVLPEEIEPATREDLTR